MFAEFVNSKAGRSRSSMWISVAAHTIVIGILLTHTVKPRAVTFGIVPVVYAAGPEEPSHVIRKPLFVPSGESSPRPDIASSTARIERSSVSGSAKKELPDGLIPLPPDLSLSADDVGDPYPVLLPVQFARVEGTLETKVDLPEPSIGRPAETPTESAPPNVHEGGNVQLARVMRRVIPIYPELARTARVEGVVLLHATINVEGVLEDIQVISGHPLLIPAAIECLAGWRYEPARLNGRPTPSSVDLTINFKLNRKQP